MTFTDKDGNCATSSRRTSLAVYFRLLRRFGESTRLPAGEARLSGGRIPTAIAADKARKRSSLKIGGGVANAAFSWNLT
jgi:hypothetical protein